MKTNCGIYAITNLINNKVYIGSSCNLKSRKYEHFRLLKNNKHVNKYLQNSFNKYGINTFNWEILEYIKKCEDKNILKQSLLDREQFYINKYKDDEGSINQNLCYNLLPTAGNNLGMKMSQEAKEKVSKNNARGMLGKICSDETRLKLSKAKKGNKYWLGKNHSEETILKLSKINKNRIRSEEFKNNLRKHMTGKKQSEETIIKKIEKQSKKVTNTTTNITFKSIKEASIYYGINEGSISKACKGKLKTAGTFTWSYG